MASASRAARRSRTRPETRRQRKCVTHRGPASQSILFSVNYCITLTRLTAGCTDRPRALIAARGALAMRQPAMHANRRAAGARSSASEASPNPYSLRRRRPLAAHRARARRARIRRGPCPPSTRWRRRRRTTNGRCVRPKSLERWTFLASRLPCKLRAARWQRAPRWPPAEEPDCPAMRRALLQPGLRLPPVQQFASADARP
jgi:hypothetical protein